MKRVDDNVLATPDTLSAGWNEYLAQDAPTNAQNQRYAELAALLAADTLHGPGLRIARPRQRVSDDALMTFAVLTALQALFWMISGALLLALLR